jgi:spermidine/putrescine-binding protein
VYVPLTGALFYEMAIPRSALRPATALAFINYSLDPVNSLLITDATRLPSPNRAAVERMAQAAPELWALYENSPAFNPPASVLDAAVPLSDADAEAATLIESLWSEVVANFTSPSQ